MKDNSFYEVWKKDGEWSRWETMPEPRRLFSVCVNEGGGGYYDTAFIDKDGKAYRLSPNNSYCGVEYVGWKGKGVWRCSAGQALLFRTQPRAG